MTQGLPCPNPTCTHTFAPEAVKGHTQLVCPRCRTVFHFGPGVTATAPPPAPPPPARLPAALTPTVLTPTAPKPGPARVPPRPAPASKPPQPPPVAPPVPLAAPVTSATAPPSSALVFGSTPDLVAPAAKRDARRRRGRRLPLVAVVLAVVCIGLAVWGYKWMRYYMNMPDTKEDSFAELGNFRFHMPEEGPWRRDPGMERTWDVNLAFRHGNPSNQMALYYRDYQQREPSEAELIDVALRKLRANLKGLQWELKPGDKAARLGGQPALRLEFEGDDSEHVSMDGECYLMTYRGYAYWFFTWAPHTQGKEARPEWPGMRDRFHLLNNREGWEARPRPTLTVYGKKVKYRLAPYKDVWQPQPPEGYDPRADVVLLGHDPAKVAHAGKAATVQVLVLGKAPDRAAAVKMARDHLITHFEDEPTTVNRKIIVIPVKDNKGVDRDRDRQFNGLDEHLSVLRVSNGDTWERFVVLAVVPRPEGVLALVCDCDWKRRDFWEHEFMPLLDTLRPAK